MLFDVTDFQTWIPLIGGIIVPFFVVLLTKPQASPTLKTLFAILAAALTALATYLAQDNLSWEGAASAFVLALIVAGASRVTISQDKVDALEVKTAGFGVG